MAVDVHSLAQYRSAVSDNRRWAAFEPRDGDIFVCTPAKCGTTWTQAIVANLLWPDANYPHPIRVGCSCSCTHASVGDRSTPGREPHDA